MNTPLYMLHQLDDIPNNSLPNSYRFRLFRQKNDSETWAKIVTATGEFPDENKAIERFNNEFKPHPNEVPKRIIFLETSDGHAAGTATAWFGEWNKVTIGRLHWVEITPEFQGKKLGRPLIAEAMKLLSQYHRQAYLKTQESSLAAIHIYNQFGFKPVCTTNEQQTAWDRVFHSLKKRV